MPMRKRNRWFIRTGVVCCVLLIAAWVLTFRYTITFIPKDQYVCLVMGGGVHIGQYISITDGGFHVGSDLGEMFWLPRLQTRAPFFAYLGLKAIFIPFWLPFLLIATPVVWCIWRNRMNDPHAPTCENCGYILTGNTSGICPECGTNTMNDETGESNADAKA